MNPIGTFVFKLWGWVGVALYLALAGHMGHLLLFPGPDDGETILNFGAMMGFEFILIHSGVFMAVMPRMVSLFVFVPVYGLFAWGMNSIIPGNAILWLYLSVVLTRMRFAFSKPSEAAKNSNILFSCAAAMTYFVLVFIFAFSSGILPRFGITEAYLEAVNYSSLHDSGGIFIDLPHVPLTMGVVYFTILAFYEWGIYNKLQGSYVPPTTT